MATLREIITKITFKSENGKLKATEQGLRKVKKRMSAAAKEARRYKKNMNQLATAAKAFAAAAIAGKAARLFTSDFADEADRIAKFSKSTGIGPDMYQGLVHAVKLSGGEVADMDKSLQQLSKRALEVTQGNKTIGKSFTQLGVKVTDSSGKLKQPDGLLLEMADKFRAMKDGSEKTGLAMQLFGRTGAKLIPFFNEGAGGLRKYIAESRKLGHFTRSELGAAEEYNDAKLRTMSIFKGIRNRISGALLPSITSVYDAFQRWAQSGNNLSNALAELKRAANMLLPVFAALALHMKRGLFVQFGQAVMGAAKSLMLMGRAAIFAKLKLGLLLFAAVAIYDLVRLAQGEDSFIGRLFADSPEVLDNLKAMGADLIAVGTQMATELAPTGAALLKEIGGALKAVWKAIKPLVPLLLKVIVGAVKFLALLISKVLAPVLGALIYQIAEFITWIADALAPVFEGISKAILGIGGAWDSVFNAMQPTVQWLASNLRAAFDSSAAAARVAWGGVLKVFEAIKASIQWIMNRARTVGSFIYTEHKVRGIAPPHIPDAPSSRGGTQIDRSVRTGPVSVNVTAAPNMSGSEFKNKIQSATRGALQQVINDTYRSRAET